MNKVRELLLLVKEIGFSDIFSYGVYQCQLRSGILRRRTPLNGYPSVKPQPVQSEPDLTLYASNWQKITPQASWSLIQFSTHLTNSASFRPYGGIPVPLILNPPLHRLKHWSGYSNTVVGVDIKNIWEPARFTWAIDLARAYRANPLEDYADFFWGKVEEFIASNPVNCGPNWASAQEVALRLISWIIALGALKDAKATTPQHTAKITQSIWQQGCRILPTLNYARSQNNNHILSEALGLIFAGSFLQPITPRAVKWIQKGEQEFERALLKQIDDEGTYSQHSANYHRMMLQLALLYNAHLRKSGRMMPAVIKQRLALASRWLITQLDGISGRLPNLGHNDGSLILALGCSEYRDYRPTAQAAALAFLGAPCLPPGEWDQLAQWLELNPPKESVSPMQVNSPAVHKVQNAHVWGTLRGVKFHGRPAHADQLHADLWWDGINIARDAGTFSYNDAPPWQNTLDATRVHNTITIDGRDQMTRVSRFLWLDQANAAWLPEADTSRICALHNGYHKIGYAHERCLELTPDGGFLVTDRLRAFPRERREHFFSIHWLLPDWKWEHDQENLLLTGEKRNIHLHIHAVNALDGAAILPQDVVLIRGGQTLLGSCQDPVRGWESDTYGEKHVALSYSLSFRASGSMLITTEWKLSNEAH